MAGQTSVHTEADLGHDDGMARRVTPAPRLDPDLARFAAALADRSRIAMLDVLMDGRAYPIGALARRVGITAATASGHLRRLVDERLVKVEHAGRSHRVQLAGPEVAHLLETLAGATPLIAPPAVTTGWTSARARELRFARTCYDHLAGIVGVAVTRALLDRTWIAPRDDTFTAAPGVLAWLADHGRPLTDEPAVRRPLTRACLDWSERVPHLAGRLGAAIADVALAEQWVVRVRDSRALRVTQRGRTALARELKVSLPAAA
jgi:DNA-binding transcriptional ArsR family regulator